MFKDKDVQSVVHHSLKLSSLIVSRYSTKLRALSDAQVEDFGAKLAVERIEGIVPDAVNESRASSSLSGSRSTSVSRSSTTEGLDRPGSLNSSDRLGLGEFLREVEAQGVDALQEQNVSDIVESPETKEMTSEQ